MSSKEEANKHWLEGNAQSAHGFFEEALTEYDKAIAIDPIFFAARIGRAFTLKALGKITTATSELNNVLEALEDAIKSNPRNADNYINCAVVLDALGFIEEAISSCDQAIKINKNDTDAWKTRESILRHSREVNK